MAALACATCRWSPPARHCAGAPRPAAAVRHGHPSPSRGARPASAAASAAAPPGVVELPPGALVETLRTPGGATVLVLGISHVSAVSVSHVRSVIAAARPAAVLLEICRSRSGFLLDELPEGPPPPSALYFSDAVGIQCDSGLLSASGRVEGAPAAAELMRGLKCRPGVAVTVADIEADVAALMATGLFERVRPRTLPAADGTLPMFLASPSPSLSFRQAAPLASLDFVVWERRSDFPSVVSSSVVLGAGVTLATATVAAVAAAAAAAIAATKRSGGGSEASHGLRQRLAMISRVRAALAPEFFGGVTLRAGESPGVVAVAIDDVIHDVMIHDVMDDDVMPVTGLPPPAPGAGPPPGGQLLGATAAANGAIAAAGGAVNSGAAGRASGGVVGLGSLLGDALARPYAEMQAAAGRKVGVAPGAAWRAGLESAACLPGGAAVVVLGDRDVAITRQRMAAAVGDAVKAPALAIAAAAIAAIAGATSSYAAPVFESLPGGPALALAAIAVAAVAAGVALVGWPLAEISEFAARSPAEIEAAVTAEMAAVSSSTGDGSSSVALGGEDALLGWAGEALLGERDRWMAQELRRLADGTPGVSPAYVPVPEPRTRESRTRVPGSESVTRMRFRGNVARSADPLAAAKATPGADGGEYEPPRPRAGESMTVVAVVGAAHVAGIAAAWRESDSGGVRQ